MQVPPDSAEAVFGAGKSQVKCSECDAPIYSANETCVNCLLKEGLQTEGEASSETFESVLAEADVPDTHWRLGSYEILEEIGRGGMGVIYRARQRHSRRIVALKRVLTHDANSHETLVRFRREAEAAASLDHPNILPIYEVAESEDGLPFFSMKLATGGSLRTPASELHGNARRCVEIIAKVARAIEYAHSRGILHRDLQPGNILLDGRGEPMVSDFGLAKWLAETSDLTRTNTGFGTPGYIAPEQARGSAAELGPAGDIYSLGAILFNLLTGRPPFLGANALSVIAQAANGPAPRLRLIAPSLGRDLENIIARSLEREPQARYPSAGALAEDLERWLEGRTVRARRVLPPVRIWRWSQRNRTLSVTGLTSLILVGAVAWLLPGHSGTGFKPPQNSTAVLSVAVLPFKPLVPAQRDQVLEMGMADTLITKLSNSGEIIVPSLASVRRFENVEEDPRATGQKLGVYAVLEGNVQRGGGRLRLTVRLIRVADGASLWSGTFDENYTDVFILQDAIAGKVFEALALRLTPDEQKRMTRRYTQNVAAYELYFTGRYHWNKLIPPEVMQSIGFFQQAVQLDPRYALAHYGLADSYMVLAMTSDMPPNEVFPKAKAAASKALEIDDSLVEVQATLAHVAMWFDWDWAAAEQKARHAIELNPNSAFAHRALAHVLSNLGRHAEAIPEAARARELDPTSLITNAREGAALFSAGRYGEARERLQKALELDPNFWIALLFLGHTALQEGKHAEALTAFTKARESSHGNSQVVSMIGCTYASAGDPEKARAVLAELKALSAERYVPASNIAAVHLALGERDEAISYLEKALIQRDTRLTFLKIDPKWDSLRTDPQFVDVLARVGLR